MLGIDEDLEDTPRYSDNPEFESIVEPLLSNLFEMNGHLSTLQQFIKTLERNQKQGNVKSKMIANLDKKSMFHIDEITKLVKVVNSLAQRISSMEETALDKSQVISREKLIRDIRYSVQEFQGAREEFTSVSKAMNDEAKAALGQEEEARKTSGLLQEEQNDNQKAQQHTVVIEREDVNNEEFAYQQQLIQQRDQEISRIESGVSELNQIFHDLGSIVQQQGHLVDNIESNIYSVANSAQAGARELTKAMNYQRGSSKRCLMILAVFSFLLVMFILVVLS
ncbi:LAFA_0D15236g1_1 [Lachancea sp. 'fantastica']|nr:LAFA_0D15236g1_1 [Lachancea sp. 'fantastica']